jgi:tRNA pseudouridine55 synthase
MVGDFKEDEAVTIEQLTKKDKIISVTSILQTIPKIEISAEDAKKIKNGQEIILNNLCNLKNYDICYTIMGSLPIAICSFIYGYIKPIRVFNI